MKLLKVNIDISGGFETTLSNENGTISINSAGKIVNIELQGNTSYNLSGKISSIGSVSIGYNLSGKVSSIGSISIGYSLSGKVTSIGNVSIGYNLSGKVTSFGNVSIGYNLSGKVTSIGNASFGYSLSGKLNYGNRVNTFNGVTFILKVE